MRTGFAYEISPITDEVRVPLLPDSDRTWVSAGATAHVTRYLSVDLAYSYIHLNSTPVNITPGHASFNGVVTYVGTANTHVNVLALAVRYVFDDLSAPPKPRRRLYRSHP